MSLSQAVAGVAGCRSVTDCVVSEIESFNEGLTDALTVTHPVIW